MKPQTTDQIALAMIALTIIGVFIVPYTVTHFLWGILGLSLMSIGFSGLWFLKIYVTEVSRRGKYDQNSWKP